MSFRNRIVRRDTVDPRQVKAHPQNWRLHPEAQVKALEGLLDEVGWVGEILWNERTGNLIDGHARIELAIGRDEAEVPRIVVDLSEEEERLVLATLDPISALADKDSGKLSDLLSGIGEYPALDDLMAKLGKDRIGDTSPDEIPIERAETEIAYGDIWFLGKHRLACGDATKKEDADAMFDGETPNLMVTDPPYGVKYDPEWRNEAAAKGWLSYAPKRTGVVINDEKSDWVDAYLIFPGKVIYSWCAAGPLQFKAAASLVVSGFEIRNQLLWVKPHFPLSRGHYTYRHEPCWYAVKIGNKAHWIGDHSQSSVWEISLDKNVEGGHSTQKPVECMARPIRNHEGDVYDPFMGSGTTLIAAEMEGRKCFGMEINPIYVDVAIRRWEAFTGKKAHKLQE